MTLKYHRFHVHPRKVQLPGEEIHLFFKPAFAIANTLAKKSEPKCDVNSSSEQLPSDK
jgi:hypothetical protein